MRQSWLVHDDLAGDELRCPRPVVTGQELFRTQTRRQRHGARIPPRRTGNNGPMGFNPFRQQRRRPSDYVMVGAAFVIVVLLLGWALLAG